jgi:excisionase family DNA binding protein
MEKILVTIPEAVSLTGISRSFLYKRLSDGSIRSVVAGRRRLVNVASLTAWASSLPDSPLKSTAEAKKGL